MDEESRNAQEDELTVLRSMYGDDLDEAYTASVWTARAKKQASDLKEFLIKIHPQGKEKVSCGLYVKLPKGYPKVPPMLDIKNAVGLSPAQVKSILDDLRMEANQLLGGVMIAELATHCEERVNARNDQIITDQNKKSLAVQMTVRAEEHEQKRKQEELEAAERMQREDANRRAALVTQIEEEDRKTREKAMSAKQQKRAERRSVVQASLAPENALESGARKEVFDSTIIVDGVHLNVFRLNDPKPDGLGTTWTAEPVAAGSGDLPAFECFVVTFKAPFYSTTAGQRKLKELESEVQRLTQISHGGLVRLYAVKLAYRQAGPSRHSVLSILREKTDGICLGDVLHHCPQLGLETAMSYLRQILAALNVLHIHKVPHSDLTVDSILFLKSNDRSNPTIVKVRGASYYRKLADLHKSNPLYDTDISSEASIQPWPPPEAIDKPLNYTFPRDIWCLGVIWVQMTWGASIIKRFPNLESVLLSGTVDVPFDLVDIMKSMFHPAPSQRPRCQVIMEKLDKRESQPFQSPSISHRLELGTPNLDMTRLGSSPQKSYFLSSVASSWPTSASRASHSRYQEDFEHLEHLGRGGFGSVDKVKMKLDNMIYAVKRIKLKASDSETRILREVNALSQLNHRHIVRYITCWLESSILEGPEGKSHSDSSESDEPPQRRRRASAVAEDDDLFKINDSDFDSDHEITRTQSFPSVVFAKDGEEALSSDESTEDETSIEGEGNRRRPEARVVTPVSPKPNVQRVLYIQMEFVEQQTLKEAVASGLDEERCWRLFRQVLEALAHMFSLGIVHRDIKLTNILIDKHGDAKLGDFGLAQATSTAPPAEHAGAFRGLIEPGSTQGSSGVGTFLYVAPEIRNPRSGSRDLAKADMFSLGIVFFEMVQGAFNTEQERFVVIQSLRDKLTFPGSWTQKPSQRKIVELLLNHDASKRPTAVELLRSGLLPERLENRKLEEALRLLVDKGGPHHQALLAKLFSQPQDQIRPFVYDRADQAGYKSLYGVVEEHLKGIFHRHGAISMDSPLLLPFSPSSDDEKPAERYLDRQGNTVSLPTDGFLPFARMVVRRGITRIKRYSFGYTYEQGIGGGQPRTISHAMFDIVSMERNLAAEGEAIAVVESIVRSIPGLQSETWEIHVSHGAILTALFEQVPKEFRTTMENVLKQAAGSTHYVFDRNGLLDAGLPRLCVEEFESVIGLRGDLDTALQELPRRVLQAFETTKHDRDSAVFELREAIRYARMLGVRSQMVFSPGIASYHDYFEDGVMFEFAPRGKRSSVLATGGRYDHLVRTAAPPSERRPPLVVGVQVGMDRIMQALWRYQGTTVNKLTHNKIDEERSFGLWAPRRADVYVCSFQAGKLPERIEIVNMLWSQGISADLMYESAVEDSLEKIMSTCMKEGILYLVLTRAQATGSTLRVKSVLRKTEAQVSRQELVPYLTQQLAEQKRIDAAISGGKTSLAAAGGGKVTLSNDRLAHAPRETKKPAADLQLVLPAEEKGQGKKRRAKELYWDKADKLYTEIRAAIQSGIPVIAIAASATVFARLTHDTAWVSDDEAWRGVVSAFDKSDYGEQIRDAIAAKKAEGHRFVFLLSVREEPRRAFMFHFTS